MREPKIPRDVAQVVTDLLPIAADPDGLMSIDSVAVLVGLSKRTIRYMVARKEFPEPIHINRRVVRWVLSDIREWIHAKRAPNSEPLGDVVQAARAMGITFPPRSLSR